MGCWNDTCMLTHLPIMAGEEVYTFLLEQQSDEHSTCYPDAYWKMWPLHFTGKYNDYGAVESCKGKMIPAILEYLTSKMVEMEQGDNQFHDIPVKKEGFDLVKLFDADHEGRLFVQGYMDKPRAIKHVVVRKNVLDNLLNSYTYSIYRKGGESLVVTFNDMIEYGKKHFKDLKDQVEKTINELKSKTDDPEQEITTAREIRWLLLSYDDGEYGTGNPFVTVLNQLQGRLWRGLVQRYLPTLANEPESEATVEFIRSLTTWAWLDSLANDGRWMWCPPSGAGSQNDRTKAQEMLARVTLAEAEDMRRQRREEYGDDIDDDED